MIGWLVEICDDWFIYWRVVQFIRWLVYWLFDHLWSHLLVDRLIDWLTTWLIDWSTTWLIVCSIVWLDSIFYVTWSCLNDFLMVTKKNSRNRGIKVKKKREKSQCPKKYTSYRGWWIKTNWEKYNCVPELFPSQLFLSCRWDFLFFCGFLFFVWVGFSAWFGCAAVSVAVLLLYCCCFCVRDIACRTADGYCLVHLILMPFLLRCAVLCSVVTYHGIA